jgi:hypothetical protein
MTLTALPITSAGRFSPLGPRGIVGLIKFNQTVKGFDLDLEPVDPFLVGVNASKAREKSPALNSSRSSRATSRRLLAHIAALCGMAMKDSLAFRQAYRKSEPSATGPSRAATIKLRHYPEGTSSPPAIAKNWCRKAEQQSEDSVAPRARRWRAARFATDERNRKPFGNQGAANILPISRKRPAPSAMIAPPRSFCAGLAGAADKG